MTSIIFHRAWLSSDGAREINEAAAFNPALTEAFGARFQSPYEPIDSAQQAQDNSGAPPEPAGAR